MLVPLRPDAPEGGPVSSAFYLPGSIFSLLDSTMADWRRAGTILVFR